MPKCLKESRRFLKIFIIMGFFDSIKGAERLTVRVTHWIHNGINYFYVAEAVSESGTYLFFEEGIRGMTNAAISIKDFEYDKILRQK